MITTLADQYLAQNAGRRYPFRDDTELPDWLPDSGVLDFRCTLYGVQAGTAPEARLVNVARTSDGNVRFTVDLSASGVVVDTIRFIVPSDMSGEPYTAYASGDRSTGSLTVTAAAIPPSTEAPPYDAEVEYLESTGTQWIDTGFRLMLSDVAECKASIGNRNSILGAIDGSRRFNITGGGGDTFAYYPGNGYLGRTATSLNQPYVFTLGDGSFAIDGTVTGTTTYVDFTFTTSCVIFARNIGTGVNDYLSGSIYYFTIRRGGKIVMDLHPVRFTNEFGQTEGAMYDRVSGQLFRNQGTAANAAPFLYGDDVAPAPGAGGYPVDIPLAATTVVCDSLKVMSLQSANTQADARDDDDPAARTVTTAISGDIEIAEGRNTEPYLDGNSLRLDIFKGGGLGERCQSAVMGGQRCDTVLFTINGERPGSDGDLRIVGESGVTVKPIPEEHAIEITMDDATAGLMSEGCAPECSEA